MLPPRTFNLLASLVAVWLVCSRTLVLFLHGSGWAEWDSSAFVLSLKSFWLTEDLTSQPNPYPNGMAYQSFAVIGTLITGMEPREFLLLWTPILSLVVFPAAYILFRTILRNSDEALLSTFLLSLFPFTAVLTSSAGANTVVFVAFITFFWTVLEQSVRSRGSRQSAIRIILLVFLAFTNVYFAVLLVAVLGTSALVSRIIQTQLSQHWSNLSITVRNGVLILVFTAVLVFWVYPPAVASLYQSRTWTSGMIEVFFGGAPPLPYAYAYIGSAYPGVETYILLTLSQWILALLSVVFGALLLLRSLRRHGMQHDLALTSCSSIYSSLGFLLVAAILFDIANGSNFQLRVFAFLSIFIPPVVVSGVWPKEDRRHAKVEIGLPNRRRWGAKLATALLVVAVLAGTPAVALQLVRDPSVTKNWIYYSPQEEHAVLWLQSRDSDNVDVFLGAPYRLWAVFRLNQMPSRTPTFVITDNAQSACLLMWSDLEAVRAPQVMGSIDWMSLQRVYDNGGAVFYVRATCK